MARFLSGKTSRVSVEGSVLSLRGYTTVYGGIDLETTNFESNGFNEGIIGVLSLTWTLDGDWDANANPQASPPKLYPRDDGVAMTLYTKVTDNKFFNLPLWRCFNSNVDSTIDGKVTFKADGKSQGTFTVPL